MTPTATCPDCGCGLASPESECPACLMRLGLSAADSGPDDTTLPSPAPARARPPELPADDGLLKLEDEVARGGLGQIFWARDVSLGRVVAVKVLQQRHCDRPDLVSSFVEEARLTARLQHPGIVPVHRIGRLADGRPYFAMKLVRGRSLAELLAQRTLPEPQLVRLLQRVAEAVAYAHSRRVVHRDLKPANIMVGRFGEVQVMDWGLAVVLPEEAVEAASADAAPEATGRGSGSSTVAGTPAYMAPELFDAASSRPDERADVFALGAMLVEVLTGRPVYDAPSPDAVRRAAAACHTGPALAAMGEAAVDPELTGLAAACLSADRDARPADAAEVAGRLSHHFETAAERARQAQIARAEAEARSEGEARRRRLRGVVGLFAVVLLVGILVAASQWQLQRAAREASAMETIASLKATLESTVARPDGSTDAWSALRERVRSAGAELADAPASPRAALADLAGRVEAGAADADRDARLLADLEVARLLADRYDYAAAIAAFEDAFERAGLDVTADPEAVGRRVASRPSDVRNGVIAGLDVWAALLGTPRFRSIDPDRRLAPLTAARAADTDPWRAGLRDAFDAFDLDRLAKMARSVEAESQPAEAAWLAGKLLFFARRDAEAGQVLADAVMRHPDAFWLQHDLARLRLGDVAGRAPTPPTDSAAALAHATAAVALRPGSPAARVRLADVYEALGDFPSAERELRRAISLRADFGHAHGRLANLLNFNTDRYSEAVELYLQAEKLEPLRAQPYRIAAADALIRLERHAEALPVIERCLAYRDDDAVTWYLLARARLGLGEVPAAAEAMDRAVDLLGEAPLPADFAEVQRQVEQAIKTAPRP